MIKVIQSGIQTTIQDQGRTGYQSFGISVGGAMSTYSSRLANILVGNELTLPILEIVQSPHSFFFEEDALVSFCGGGLIPELNEKELPVYEPILIEAGSIIKLHKPQAGFRLYMSIAGGFKAELFLGSYSTHLISGSGGYSGRIIRKNDCLSVQTKPSFLSQNIQELIKRNLYFNLDKTRLPKIFSKTIRIIKGSEYNELSESSKQKLTSSIFTVSNDYNRMGYRLKGEPLSLSQPKEMISSATTKGTIQLLPDGQIIALMADYQTVGGYPKIAHIIEADHCICAQLKPGDEISFVMISLEEAEQLYLEQEERLVQVRETIQQIFS
ncbi:MAG TPA: biotin-dependent carboxyltransferase family protein [Chitinophagaceae bacterium]|nr:biotin-dependent carboxyltransferase family protein [Chitinophagaceae bacterium]